MNILAAVKMRPLRASVVATMVLGVTACGGGGDLSSPVNVKGTAAVGAALANAQVKFACKNGSGATTTDANGAYSVNFSFDAPCAVTATSGGITIHSFVAGGGTYNVTPLTELMLSYLAGQLGTNVSGLLAGIQSDANMQKALTTTSVIVNAQAGVVALIKKLYGITLSSGSFLTVSFTPGQPGADADLDTLLKAGAITADGLPSASLAAAALQAGALVPISSNAGGSTGGTGGSGTAAQ